MDEVISKDDTKRFTETVFNNLSIDLRDYAHFSLQRRLTKYLQTHRYKTLDGLIAAVEQGMDREEFIQEFTVNTTEMFRDPSFWVELKKEVLPALSDRETLRIWHAGCSTGQELFSMSILLHEMKLLSRTKFFATDIDNQVLNVTKAGLVPKRVMKTNLENYAAFNPAGDLLSYFTEESERYILQPELISSAMIRKHDLVQEGSFSKFDLILCRNVLIYFNQQLQNRVIMTFRDSLFRKSFLAVGSKESLSWCTAASNFNTVSTSEKIFQLK